MYTQDIPQLYVYTIWMLSVVDLCVNKYGIPIKEKVHNGAA
jgi:hypothetical protein